MGIAHAGRKLPSCMATQHYCERGACGPDGAGWFCCCSRAFFRVSTPPPGGGGRGGGGAPRRRGLRGRTSDDRAWLAVVACQPGQEEAGDEEADRQYRRPPRQEVGGAAARAQTLAR